MSEMILWISAAAEKPPRIADPESERRSARNDTDPLPVHTFPGESSREKCGEKSRLAGDQETGSAEEHVTYSARTGRYADYRPELDRRYEQYYELERQRRIYRGRTVRMLRRYLQYSIDTGRLPSLLGREFFRSKVSKYEVATFEDRVIFVHDMETCLHRLDDFSQRVLGRIVLQDYGHEEAARLLGCTRMTVHRTLIAALDELSQILMQVGLLGSLSSKREKSCQEGQDHDLFVSYCEERK